MSALSESRARKRNEDRMAQLERELLLKRAQADRYYHRIALLEQLVRAQAALLHGLRNRNHKQVGEAMEKMLALRRRLADE